MQGVNRMLAKKILFGTIFGLLIPSQNVFSEPVKFQPTTQYFSVKNFYVFDQSGYKPYSVDGFYEGVSNVADPKLLLFPKLRLNKNNIIVLDSKAKKIDNLDNLNADDISKIIIIVKYNPELPTKQEGVGISYALNGMSSKGYIVNALRNPDKTIPYHQNIFNLPNGLMYKNIIDQQYNSYDNERKEQQQLEEFWKKYKLQTINFEDLKLQALDQDEVLGESTTIEGGVSFNGDNISIIIKNPSIQTLNLILDGNYQVKASFLFKDSSTSSIDAKFDQSIIMSKYVKQTQDSLVSNKSSGWKIFNFGNRRKSVKESYREQIEQQTKTDEKTNTAIVMEDADEDMIKIFENKFFPEVTRDQVVKDHLAAAQVATSNNQPDLAKAHTAYVTMLTSQDESSKVNAAEAAAALSEKNYAMFVAKGMETYDNSGKATGHYQRIITQGSEYSKDMDWNYTKKRTVKRKYNILMNPLSESNQKGSLGICGIAPYQYNKNYLPYNHPNYVYDAFMITCVTEGSPLHKSNIVPGTIFDTLNNKKILNLSDLEDALINKKPGDSIRFAYANAFTPYTQTIDVKLAVGLNK